MKSQMRAANKSGAAFTVIRGEDELTQGTAALKDMVSGEQVTLPLDKLVPELTTRIRSGPLAKSN